MLLYSLKVGDYMNPKPAVLTPGMAVEEAVDKLIKAELTGGPVIDENKKVVGFLSEQDCLKMMLEGTYHKEQSATVADCMSEMVVTVKANASIIDLAQQLGSNRPKVYPVVDDSSRLVGVISRTHILKAICLQLSDSYRNH